MTQEGERIIATHVKDYYGEAQRQKLVLLRFFFSFNFMNAYNKKLLFSPFYRERHSLYAQRGKMSVHGVKEIE